MRRPQRRLLAPGRAPLPRAARGRPLQRPSSATGGDRTGATGRRSSQRSTSQARRPSRLQPRPRRLRSVLGAARTPRGQVRRARERGLRRPTCRRGGGRGVVSWIRGGGAGGRGHCARQRSGGRQPSSQHHQPPLPGLRCDREGTPLEPCHLHHRGRAPPPRARRGAWSLQWAQGRLTLCPSQPSRTAVEGHEAGSGVHAGSPSLTDLSLTCENSAGGGSPGRGAPGSGTAVPGGESAPSFFFFEARSMRGRPAMGPDTRAGAGAAAAAGATGSPLEIAPTTGPARAARAAVADVWRDPPPLLPVTVPPLTLPPLPTTLRRDRLLDRDWGRARAAASSTANVLACAPRPAPGGAATPSALGTAAAARGTGAVPAEAWGAASRPAETAASPTGASSGGAKPQSPPPPPPPFRPPLAVLISDSTGSACCCVITTSMSAGDARPSATSISSSSSLVVRRVAAGRAASNTARRGCAAKRPTPRSVRAPPRMTAASMARRLSTSVQSWR